MTEHPGYFWPCLMLFFCALNSCDVGRHAGRIADALEAQKPKEDQRKCTLMVVNTPDGTATICSGM